MRRDWGREVACPELAEFLGNSLLSLCERKGRVGGTLIHRIPDPAESYTGGEEFRCKLYLA